MFKTTVSQLSVVASGVPLPSKSCSRSHDRAARRPRQPSGPQANTSQTGAAFRRPDEAGRAGDFSTGFPLRRRGRAGWCAAIWEQQKKVGWEILRFGETSTPRSAPAQVNSTCSSRASTRDFLQSGGISKLLPRVLCLGGFVGGRERRVVGS